MRTYSVVAPTLWVVAEFGLLLLLGFALMRLIYWQSRFNDQRLRWLAGCRESARQLRVFRRQVMAVDTSMFRLPLSPRWQKKMTVLLWAAKLFKRSGTACS